MENLLARIKVEVRGIVPLLMHRGGLANPLDPWTQAMKEITSKRKKTEEDHLELSKREFLGGLYYDEETGVHVPAEVIEACIRDGAKANKLGKSIQSAVFCEEEKSKLIYDGPKDPAKLYEKGFTDTRRVGIGKASVMRTRPRFNRWSLVFHLTVDTSVVNIDDVRTAVENAGRLKGLCDFRPRYGRFEVTQYEEAALSKAA